MYIGTLYNSYKNFTALKILKNKQYIDLGQKYFYVIRKHEQYIDRLLEKNELLKEKSFLENIIQIDDLDTKIKSLPLSFQQQLDLKFMNYFKQINALSEDIELKGRFVNFSHEALKQFRLNHNKKYKIFEEFTKFADLNNQLNISKKELSAQMDMYFLQYTKRNISKLKLLSSEFIDNRLKLNQKIIFFEKIEQTHLNFLKKFNEFSLNLNNDTNKFLKDQIYLIDSKLLDINLKNNEMFD